jgi:hypothetical protein
MKRLSFSTLAAVAMVITANSAFGQMQNVGYHQGGGNYVGYQTSDLSYGNQCQSGRATAVIAMETRSVAVLVRRAFRTLAGLHH